MTRIIHDLPADQYHAHPAIGRSGLELIAQSPKHYWDRYLNPDRPEQDDNEHFAFGRAFHSYILEPELFRDTYVTIPADAPKKPTSTQINAKKPSDATLAQLAWWSEFAAKTKGKQLLTNDDYERLENIAQNVRQHGGARALLSMPGKAEVTVFWNDPVTGVECKARFDWLTDDGIIVDTKTCRTANPDGEDGQNFIKDAYAHGYPMQAAWYSEGYRQAFGKDPAAFVFIAAEKTRPYCVSVMRTTEVFVAYGDTQWRKHLSTYAACLKTGIWPAYSDKIIELGLPDWVERKFNNNQGE